MNKTFKYAISVVLSAAMVTPALAQRDNFPDVADTHWAYEAVARLKKEGIATGFPDGTFQGKRMMTRYEMASLLYALYMNLKNVTDGLGAQITALETRVNGMSTGGGDKVDNSEVQALRDSVASLRKDMSSMKSWGDDITQMKKMSSTYEKELSQMGVDVESMKKDLSDINMRLKKLEGGGMSSNVKISGDANFFMGAGFKGNLPGGTPINSDGRGFGSTGSGAGIDSLTVLHELGLNVSASNVVGEIVVGNMLGNGTGTGFSDGSSTASSRGTMYNGGSNNTNVYLNRLYATLNDGIGGLNFDAKIGRQGLKLGSFVLQRPDTTTFYSQDRMDNGEYTMDGASFKFGLGANTDLGLFFGQTNNNAGTSGNGIMPIQIGEPQSAQGNPGSLSTARTMGATLGFKIGENGHLGLSFVDFDSNTLANTPGSNRLEVFGADLGYKLSDSISLSAGTGRSQFKAGSSNVTFGSKNTRTNFGIDWTAGALGLNLGYSEVGNGYLAPGAWGKSAIYHNLNDLKTTSIKGHYELSDKLTIRGGYVKGDQMSATNKDAVKSTTLGADFKINSNWTLMADYEDTKFKGGFVTDGAAPQFKFTTLGFGYDMGANTMFKMFYQMSDINGIAGTSPLFGSSVGGVIKGSQIGAQFSVKF